MTSLSLSFAIGAPIQVLARHMVRPCRRCHFPRGCNLLDLRGRGNFQLLDFQKNFLCTYRFDHLLLQCSRPCWLVAGRQRLSTQRWPGHNNHHHDISTCVAAQVDVAGGASHLIGIAADGFPIYGDKGISGSTVTVAQLDACNGVISATPEFPNCVYHYVLLSGVTGFQSFLRCYSATATKTQVASLQSPGVCASSFAKAVPTRVWACATNSGNNNTMAARLGWRNVTRSLFASVTTSRGALPFAS